MDANTMTYAELKAKADEYAQAAAAMLNTARAEAIETIVKLVTDFNITGDELNKRLGHSGKGKPGRKAGSGAGVKAAPKYRNPADGATWTGRGVAPKWMPAKEDVAAREAMLIPAGEAPATNFASTRARAEATVSEDEVMTSEVLADPIAEVVSEAPKSLFQNIE